jgi:hypothetical protein
LQSKPFQEKRFCFRLAEGCIADVAALQALRTPAGCTAVLAVVDQFRWIKPREFLMERSAVVLLAN